MTRIFSLALALLCLCSPLAAQRITPVHYLIASNSMLTRPEPFRQLQLGIEKEWDNVGKGLKLDLLDERMRVLRELVLARFDVEAAKITVMGNGLALSSVPISTPLTNLGITFNGNTISFSTDNLSFRQSLDQAETALGALLSSMLGDAADRTAEDLRNVGSPLLRQVIDGALTVAVNELRGTSAASWMEEIASAFTRQSEAILKERIRARIPGFRITSSSEWKDYLSLIPRDSLTMILQQSMHGGLAEARMALSRALDQAEVRIRTLVEGFNRWLLTGNTGMAISQSQGDLGAGLHVTYTNSSTFQLGVYVNTEFDPVETKSARGLVGGQIRYGTGRLQIDLLGSAVLGTDWGLEGGVGVSYNPGKSVVLGAAFFSTINSVTVDAASIDGWSVGLTMRGTAENSPTIVLGASKLLGKPARPLFQVIYPIRP